MSNLQVHDLTFDRAWAICRSYEGANGISSEDFVASYQKGLIEPTPLAMRWVSTYEAMLRLAPSDLGLEEDLRIPA